MEITKDKVGEFLVSGVWDVACSTSEDADAKKAGDSVKFTIRFKLDKVPLLSILAAAFSPKKINYQNYVRKHIALFKDGQVVEQNFTGGRVQADPEDVMAARLKAMTPEARAKWFSDRGIKL